MTSNTRQPEHRDPHDALTLVRLVLSWLLVAVLAVDLATSPLHGHGHDGEWSAGGPLGAAHANDIPGPGGADVPVHVEHDELPGFSHSIAALRSLVLVMAEVPPLDEVSVAAPGLVPTPWSLGRAAAFVWPPDRHRAGSGAFRSLPPHGRAPPLHA